MQTLALTTYEMLILKITFLKVALISKKNLNNLCGPSYNLVKMSTYCHIPKVFFEISSGLQLSSKLLASYKILSKRIRYLKVQPSPYYISDSPYCKFLNGSR